MEARELKNTPNTEESTEIDWAMKLFSKSVLKQAKLKNLLLGLGGNFDNSALLDLGSDNGVISYKLRALGGTWSSADLTAEVVESIKSLVAERVYLIDGKSLPFKDAEFDKIVVVDMLEHIEDERRFISELHRITKPGGALILNTPNLKPFSLLRAFRHLIGQTDEKHGHLRPGYGKLEIEKVCAEHFELERTWTYSRFFAEAIDTGIVCAYGLLKKLKGEGSEAKENEIPKEEISKGLVVTQEGLKSFEKQFKLYALIYPIVSAVSKLDLLLKPLSGFMRLSVLKRF